MKLKLAIATVACLALAACQLDYGIDVIKRDGQVAFHVFQGKPNKPASVERLTVSEVSSQERKVWEIESPEVNGQDLSDVRYGQVPAGLKQTVAAEPLKVGQLYVVSMFAVGGAELAYFIVSPGADDGRPVIEVAS